MSLLCLCLLFYPYFHFSSPDGCSLSCHPSNYLYFSVSVISHLLKVLLYSEKFCIISVFAVENGPIIIMESTLFWCHINKVVSTSDIFPHNIRLALFIQCFLGHGPLASRLHVNFSTNSFQCIWRNHCPSLMFFPGLGPTKLIQRCFT